MHDIIAGVLVSVLSKLVWWQVERLASRRRGYTESCQLCHSPFKDADGASQSHDSICNQCQKALELLTEK